MAVKKNKFAFWPELIGKTELTDVDVDEVSIVHPPANQHSRVVMIKSLAFNFTPLGFAKAGLADPSWPDESPIDDATDPDMNFTGRVTQKKRAKQVKKMVAKMVRKPREISATVKAAGTPSARVIAFGAQDARSPAEHANDAAAILAEMLRNPVAAEEAHDFHAYMLRVFGAEALSKFTSAELRAAKMAFDGLRENSKITKFAGDALNNFAFALKHADPSLSTAQAFVKAARGNPALYAASRGLVETDNPVITGTIANGAIDQFESPRKARTVRKDQRADSTMNVAGDDADSMSPEEANAYILQCANDLQQQYPHWSRTMCLMTAGAQHPGVYHRSKQQS